LAFLEKLAYARRGGKGVRKDSNYIEKKKARRGVS
jgi:hypothetical protein